MQPLLSDEPRELDPETKAIVDEVCTALEWFSPDIPGSHEPAQAMRFGRKWWIAFRNTANHECRQAIIDCCDAIVRADDELVRTFQGHIFTRDDVRANDGRMSYVVDSETGESHRLLEWPSDYFAGGAPAYRERRDAA